MHINLNRNCITNKPSPYTKLQQLSVCIYKCLRVPLYQMGINKKNRRSYKDNQIFLSADTNTYRLRKYITVDKYCFDPNFRVKNGFNMCMVCFHIKQSNCINYITTDQLANVEFAKQRFARIRFTSSLYSLYLGLVHSAAVHLHRPLVLYHLRQYMWHINDKSVEVEKLVH